MQEFSLPPPALAPKVSASSTIKMPQGLLCKVMDRRRAFLSGISMSPPLPPNTQVVQIIDAVLLFEEVDFTLSVISAGVEFILYVTLCEGELVLSLRAEGPLPLLAHVVCTVGNYIYASEIDEWDCHAMELSPELPWTPSPIPTRVSLTVITPGLMDPPLN